MSELPFRWDLTRRNQLGSLLEGEAAATYKSFPTHLLACCARVVAFSGDSDLIFVGRSPESIFDHLSGLLFGYLYVKFVPRRGLLFSASEASYGISNRYHRWKRRRAGRKFQVYMKKHNQDAKDYFDEYGNFRPPDDKDKKNGGSTGGWVN